VQGICSGFSTEARLPQLHINPESVILTFQSHFPGVTMKYLILSFVVAFLLLRLLSSKPNISADDIKTALRNGGTIIDVRTPAEFSSGSIKGSVNLPLGSIIELAESMNLSLDLPLILYCASGMRSARAMKLLKKEGYRNVYNGGSIHNLKSVL
jgi:phage shock protein E